MGAGTNTVLFDEETAGFKAPYYVGHDNPNGKPNCGKVYKDLFICKDVPTKYSKANDCLNKDKKQVCKSCKVKYPKAERFWVDVNQDMDILIMIGSIMKKKVDGGKNSTQILVIDVC